jgi:hypothetical protein
VVAPSLVELLDRLALDVDLIEEVESLRRPLDDLF